LGFISKDKYQIFSFGKIYKVNKGCEERLKKLDNLRDYIWSVQAPLILVIMFVAILLSGLLFTLYKLENIEAIVVWLMIILYLFVSLIYYLKIRNAINCEKL